MHTLYKQSVTRTHSDDYAHTETLRTTQNSLSTLPCINIREESTWVVFNVSVFLVLISHNLCAFSMWTVALIDALKMVTLPRFLFFFSKPANFPAFFFLKPWIRIVLPIMQDFKAHHISKLHVCKPRSLGRLGLPNFHHYYWVVNCCARLHKAP